MDVTVTYSALEAMQVQTALGERIVKLRATPQRPGSFEAEVVDTAVRHANTALASLLEALYPEAEAVDEGLFEKGEDLAAGDFYAGMEHLPSSVIAVAFVDHPADARATGAPPVAAGRMFEGMD